MTAGLFGSMSRAGIIGAAVGLIAFIALSRTRIRKGRGLIWISGALTAMIGAALLSNFGALAMRLRDTTESGEWGRRAIWRDTWRMAQDFWLTGVGAGAFQRGMLVYQEGSRQFFFNHAHDEYLQLASEGGLLLAVPAAIAVVAGVALIVARLRGDRTPIFWLRAGAASGLIAVAIQSIWDTGLRTPANGTLFAVIAAIALHQPRPPHDEPAGRSRSRSREHETNSSS
jgi:O-antigen ligase